MLATVIREDLFEKESIIELRPKGGEGANKIWGVYLSWE